MMKPNSSKHSSHDKCHMVSSYNYIKEYSTRILSSGSVHCPPQLCPRVLVVDSFTAMSLSGVPSAMGKLPVQGNSSPFQVAGWGRLADLGFQRPVPCLKMEPLWRAIQFQNYQWDWLKPQVQLHWWVASPLSSVSSFPHTCSPREYSSNCSACNFPPQSQFPGYAI